MSDVADGVPGGALHTPPRRRLIYRHSAVVRVTHWVNVVCLTVLLMSGLQIFNAHPALYWGNPSDFDHPVLALTAEQKPNFPPRGVTAVFGHPITTTGVLGLSRDGDGALAARGFPAWATLPGQQALAQGRLWHFFFAWIFVLNGAVYLVAGLAGGHFWKDLIPSGQELRRIGQTAYDHLLFRFPKGEEARRYNVLQQLTYLVVVAAILPLILLAGLTMSPRMDAAFPQLLTLFDGRQSARTVHFVLAWALVAFVLVHIFMVLVSGVWNNLRSMLTGRYAIEDDHHEAQ